VAFHPGLEANDGVLCDVRCRIRLQSVEHRERVAVAGGCRRDLRTAAIRSFSASSRSVLTVAEPPRCKRSRSNSGRSGGSARVAPNRAPHRPSRDEFGGLVC
jgi:hypothetical protein